MAIDLKYGVVSLENGSIGPDEPIFILRAQDGLIGNVLATYKGMCERAGSPAEHLAAIDEALHQINRWQIDHVEQVKVPD